MLREKIEGKWIAAFRRFLTLNGVGPGVPIAIVAESQSQAGPGRAGRDRRL